MNNRRKNQFLKELKAWQEHLKISKYNINKITYSLLSTVVFTGVHLHFSKLKNLFFIKIV
jgi:hypothetical protein